MTSLLAAVSLFALGLGMAGQRDDVPIGVADGDGVKVEQGKASFLLSQVCSRDLQCSIFFIPCFFSVPIMFHLHTTFHFDDAKDFKRIAFRNCCMELSVPTRSKVFHILPPFSYKLRFQCFIGLVPFASIRSRIVPNCSKDRHHEVISTQPRFKNVPDFAGCGRGVL